MIIFLENMKISYYFKCNLSNNKSYKDLNNKQKKVNYALIQ